MPQVPVVQLPTQEERMLKELRKNLYQRGPDAFVFFGAAVSAWHHRVPMMIFAFSLGLVFLFLPHPPAVDTEGGK